MSAEHAAINHFLSYAMRITQGKFDPEEINMLIAAIKGQAEASHSLPDRTMTIRQWMERYLPKAAASQEWQRAVADGLEAAMLAKRILGAEQIDDLLENCAHTCDTCGYLKTSAQDLHDLVRRASTIHGVSHQDAGDSARSREDTAAASAVIDQFVGAAGPEQPKQYGFDDFFRDAKEKGLALDVLAAQVRQRLAVLENAEAVQGVSTARVLALAEYAKTNIPSSLSTVAPISLTPLQLAYVAGKLADEAQALRSRHPDDQAVDRFAAAMKAKMARSREKGRGGWEDKQLCSQAMLSTMLIEHIPKGDPIDVANFAMMLHQRGEAILAEEASDPVWTPEQVEQIRRDAAEMRKRFRPAPPADPDGFLEPPCRNCGGAWAVGSAQACQCGNYQR